MSCCAAGTESAAELEALKSEAPSPEELWLSSRKLDEGLRQVDLIVPGVHCGACIALLERELPRTKGVDHARVNLSTRRVSVVFENILDAAYRIHGSSVNGPGRGVIVGATAGW